LKRDQDTSRTLEKMCWLQRGVRWRLTCANMFGNYGFQKKKKKSVPVIFEPPCIQFQPSQQVTHCVVAVRTFFKSQSIMHMEEFLGQMWYANVWKNCNCCLCSCTGSTLAQYWKTCLMTHVLRWKRTSSDTINECKTAVTLHKTFKNINLDTPFYHDPSDVGNLNFVSMLTQIIV
jgi:hypothetical protein